MEATDDAPTYQPQPITASLDAVAPAPHNSTPAAQNPPTALVESPPKPRAPICHTFINNQGLIETINLHSGATISIQTRPGDDLLQNRFDDMVQIDTPQGKVWIDKYLDPTKLLLKSSPPYNIQVADLLANVMAEGKTLNEAIKSIGMKPSTINKWRREFPEFNKALIMASQDRAESLKDEALDIARATTSDTLGPDKLKVDTLMKTAAVDNPDRFATRQKVDTNVTATTTFIISTGINRDALPPGDFEQAIRDATPVQEVEATTDSIDDEFSRPLDAVRENDGASNNEAGSGVGENHTAGQDGDHSPGNRD